MKKLVTIILVCFCFSPAFAQRGLQNVFRGMKNPAAQTSIRAGVKTTLERTWLQATRPANSYIQITNMPGKPTVKLGGNVDNMPKVLSARVLTGEENMRLVFPNMPSYSEKYLPSSLNSEVEEEFGYRGLQLYDLWSISNILENGLEWKRGGYDGKIFFTGNLNRVTDFITEHTDERLFPTIVQFVVPYDRKFIYTRESLFNIDYYIWLQNIRAYAIRDVMVFLEVNGKPGWYKATLENGELVFTPVQSRVFNRDEIFIHNFDIPEGNMGR